MMDPNAEDAQLVAAAQSGDRSALATLLSRHRPLLLTLCHRALGDPGLAEDAAQEASLLAMLHLDRLRRAERFGSWLAGIGLNVCHRWRRQRSREAWSWEAMLGGAVSEPIDPTPSPDEWAEANALRAWVRQAVSELPRGQREAVVLHYLMGLTQSETARLLGIESGAVKTRLHKARASLRRRHWPESENASTEEKIAMVEMRVVDVRRRRELVGDEAQYRHIVILEEVNGPRRLTIWVGEFEATALALHFEGVAVPRPITYAFAAELLRAAGGQLREVRLDRLVDEVYYATAVVSGADGLHEIDARPSDAFNMAVLIGSPIWANPEILAISDPARCGEEWAKLDQYTDGAAAIAATVSERKTPTVPEETARDAGVEP